MADNSNVEELYISQDIMALQHGRILQRSKDTRRRILYQRYLRSLVLTPKDKELQEIFAVVNQDKLQILQECFSSDYIIHQWDRFKKQRVGESDDNLKKIFINHNLKYQHRIRKTKNLQQLCSRQVIKSLGGLWLRTKGTSYIGSIGVKIVNKELGEMQQMKSFGILI